MTEAWLRLSLFIVSIGVVHLAGFYLYRAQFLATARESLASAEAGQLQSTAGRSRVSSQLFPAIRFALIQQLAFMFFAALLLDGGNMFRTGLQALVVHWSAIVVIFIRRAASPTSVDLSIIRYGFIPTMVIMKFLAPMAWTLREFVSGR